MQLFSNRDHSAPRPLTAQALPGLSPDEQAIDEELVAMLSPLLDEAARLRAEVEEIAELLGISLPG